MKKIISIFLFSFLLPFYFLGQDTFDLKIKVENIGKMEGELRICLGNKKKDFLKKCYQFQSVKVTQKEMWIIFKNIPTGKYVINIYHDEDNNGELNTNGLFGSPSEDYGFSNNPKSLFGPPSFKKCLFDINSNTEISIKL